MDSFWRLNGDRQVGMGLGPIPFSAIDRYARRYGMTQVDRFDRFLAIIRAMDSEYIRIQTDQPEEGVVNVVSAEDGKGARDLFKRLAAQRRQAEPEPPPPPARKSRSKVRAHGSRS